MKLDDYIKQTMVDVAAGITKANEEMPGHDVEIDMNIDFNVTVEAEGDVAAPGSIHFNVYMTKKEPPKPPKKKRRVVYEDDDEG